MAVELSHYTYLRFGLSAYIFYVVRASSKQENFKQSVMYKSKKEEAKSNGSKQAA